MSTFAAHTLKDTNSEAIIKLTGEFTDGTQETTVLKIDASGLTGADGGETYHELMIAKVIWSCSGDGKIKIIFDGGTDATALTIAGGNGTFSGVEPSINIPNNAVTPTGDITFTTTGFAADDNYTVILYLQKAAPGFILSTETGESTG